MRTHDGRLFALLAVVAMTGCARAPEVMDTTSTSTAAQSEPTTASTAPGEPSATDGIQNIFDLPSFAPLEPGTYFIDPDHDPSTPLRVVYEIPVEGWSMWAGATKGGDEGALVAVSITTVNNLVSDGCSGHLHRDPPIGPSVEDLATGLADLAPFEVTSPPEDVSIYGYRGKHLVLTVPDLPVEPSGDFIGCTDGNLKSWVAPFDTTPGDAFYGYTGPGFTEEFWILDVDGTRLVIAAERSAGSSEKDLDELRAILDSVRMEP
jgi:hypothetical protein